MKTISLALASAMMLSQTLIAEMKPHSLTVGEGFENPLGYHDASPSFSWKLPEGVKKQSAYQIQLTSESSNWDSGWIESDQSVMVPFEGEDFQSRQQAEWQVRFRDQDGKESSWSEKADFEMGLLSAADWQAHWIHSSDQTKDPEAAEPVAYLRRNFQLSEETKQARLYVTAKGVFELHLNSKRIGNDYFANGFTSYSKRLDTLTYDVTGLLQEGENLLEAKLGNGWYSGRLGWQNEKALFGDYPELLLQLELTLSDGTRQTVTSDKKWEGTWKGPILSSSIYDGEHYDARREVEGWLPVEVEPKLGEAQLVPKPFAPVRATEVLPTLAITEPEPGRFIFDLGQNMVGWPKLSLPVEEGKTVTIRFAEMLKQDGTMYTENYRTAKSTNSYTADTTGTITWEPSFTFHGFRYVELSGLREGITPEKNWVQGVVLHTDMERTGTFSSSHEKLNQLYRNIVWGQRGNFLDIPTDCPQRDERLGWTGDAQAFFPTAIFNYDCHAFFKSWLDSMRADQLPNGSIPWVIPSTAKAGSPGWMDAATIIPWQLFLRTGDYEVLENNYEMMQKLVGHYRKLSKEGIIPKISGFGDWLQPYAKDNKGDTPLPYLGSAFYAQSTRILADTALFLGKDEDAQKFRAEADFVRQSFASKYFDEQGTLQNMPETQTGYILALEFKLLPNHLRDDATGHLIRLIEEADGHLRTGFLGTPYIARVLDEMGYPELAYSILFKESYPSWFFSINQGATTMWERWNSYSHEDGFGNVAMNSFNHYAYGAIGQWMVERVAGLAPDPSHPGYQHILVRPLPGGPLTWAKAELETPYGKAASAWKKEGDKLTMTVTVPPNATATIEFPNEDKPQQVAAGTHVYEMTIAAK